MSISTFKQAAHILSVFDQQGLLRESYQILIDGGYLVEIARAAENGTLPTREVFHSTLKAILTVDYDQTLEQMIADGKYVGVNNVREKRFLIDDKRKGVVEFERRYFRYNRGVRTFEIPCHIQNADRANPWMPAKIEHLLANGSQFPNDQHLFSIVAPGSIVESHNRRYMPCLGSDEGFRHLFVHPCKVRWDHDTRFLAVRELSRS